MAAVANSNANFDLPLHNKDDLHLNKKENVDDNKILSNNSKSVSLDEKNDNENDSESKEPITAFTSADAFTVKHPLLHKWTLFKARILTVRLWYGKPVPEKAKNVDWSSLMKEVITFDSVEAFWGLHNNIAKATGLPTSSSYNIFHTGIRPEWEDQNNAKGGKWSYLPPREQVDEKWLDTILATIGETFEGEDSDEINGVIVVRKRVSNYRIDLWTRTVTNEAKILAIGKRFKELVKADSIHFTSHMAKKNDPPKFTV